MPTAAPEPAAVATRTGEPVGPVEAQPRVDFAPSEPAMQPEAEPRDRPDPEPVVVPFSTSEPPRVSSPVDPLYALIRAHAKLAQRLVKTRRGHGKLWQVFEDRVGVILNSSPGRVAFFHPSEVQVATVVGRLADAA